MQRHHVFRAVKSLYGVALGARSAHGFQRLIVPSAGNLQCKPHGYCGDLSKVFRIAMFKFTKAILILVATILVISGLEPLTVIKCTFLTALLAGPGIFICSSLITPDEDRAFFDIGIGSCVGIGAAAVSQQIFLPFNFSFGWLVPQIAYLFTYLWKKNIVSRKSQALT